MSRRRRDSSPHSSAERKKSRTTEIDRISNLPSDVTQKILSHLPIKDAGRTSLLSRHWRFQWSMLHSLKFDLVIDDPYDVDRALLLHNAPIHSVTIDSQNVYVKSRNFDLWIRHLSRNPIKQFILEGYKHSRGRKSYDMSSALFSCQDLSHLKLSYCSLRLPRTFNGFRMLNSLDLQRVCLLQDDVEKLICSSPLLERLTLCNLKDITRLKIEAPNLQFLKLRGDLQDAVELSNTLNLVHVSVEPKRAYGKWHRLLRSTPSIRELEISLRSLVTQEDEEATSWDFPKLQRVKVTDCSCDKFDNDFIKLLFLSCPALQELEVLSLHHEKEEVIVDYHLLYSSQLRLLKVTGLSGEEESEVEFIKFLLLSSPAIQELHILFDDERSNPRRKLDDDDDDDMGDRDCAFNQLRVMNIRGFSRDQDEVGFIKYLLSRAPMIEQLTLQPQSAQVSWEVSKLLNELKCNSVQANVKLLDPSNPSDDHYPSRTARSRSPDYSGHHSYDRYKRRLRRYRSPAFSDYDYDSEYYY